MPKKAKLNRVVLQERLKAYLMQRGPSKAREVTQSLEISQSAFSRLAKDLDQQILVTGKAAAARYALKRTITDVASPIPIYEIDERGEATHAAVLHPIHPKGFYLEKRAGKWTERFFGDLPYFIDDMRPSGFLGRLIPKGHPELRLPDNILAWNADHCLRYLSALGANVVGNRIIGDEAFRLYMSLSQRPPDRREAGALVETYGRMAANVMNMGGAGSSSAGGEQPKFLATRGPGLAQVLVKFSPSSADPVSRRIADLLICEHVAHEVLSSVGIEASTSTLSSVGNQTFLEVQRFDRIRAKGRRGVISLRALDLEFVGNLGRWTEIASGLLAQKKITGAIFKQIQWLETFGYLIGNSDMHAGNLSFYTDGEQVVGLSPVYDMLPMQYAPHQGQLIAREFAPPLPGPREALVWGEARAAATTFWGRAAKHPQISADFKKIAKRNQDTLRALADVEKMLPK